MTVTRFLVLLVVLRLVSPIAAAGQSVTQGSVIDNVRWLAGCWERRSADRVTLEIWMAPAGGMMLGAGRTVVDGTTREYEHVLIREHEGHLVFTAKPSGQTEASFTSTDVTDSSFVVENLSHDFPQRITYTRTGPDAWTARVDGPGPDGPRGFEIRMKRVSCVP